MKNLTEEQFERGDAYGLGEDEYRLVDTDGEPITSGEGEEVTAGSDTKDGAEATADAAPATDEVAAEGDSEDGADDTESVEAAAEESEEEAPAEEAATGHMIPKFRYDHQKTRNDRLERELNELKAKMTEAPAAPQQAETKAQEAPEAPAKPDRFTSLLTEKLQSALVQKNEALIAGDAVKASELDIEVMELQREISSTSTPKQTTTAQPQIDADTVRQQVRMEMMLDDALDNAIGSYAELNEASGKYDEKAVNRIVALQQTFIQTGMTGLEAFNEAVDTLSSTFTPLNAPAPSQTPPAKRMTDVKKNIAAARSQPPSLGDIVGSDSDKNGLKADGPDPSQLSDEEFDKLPQEVRRRMRGDFVSS